MEEGMKKADGRWRSNADGPVSGRTCVLLYFRTRQPVPFSSGLYVICTCAKRPRSLPVTPSPLILSVHLSDHMRRASALSQQSPSSPTKAPPSPRTTMDVHGSDDDDDLIRAKILLMGQRRSVPLISFHCGAPFILTLVLAIPCICVGAAKRASSGSSLKV